MNKNLESKNTSSHYKWLNIWQYSSELPIIQWWMWVWISTYKLAWAVSLNWWIGTLSSAGLCKTPPYKHLYDKAIRDEKQKNWNIATQRYHEIFQEINCIAIQSEIEKAKKIANGKWPIFINIMNAVTWFKEQVLAACEAWVDWIVCGAWLPLNLPEITKDYPNIALIPILSNQRWVKLVLENRNRKYKRLPDAIILEDPIHAWGHLWVWKIEDLENLNSEDLPNFSLEKSIPKVKKYLQENNYNIPIIAAWWIYNNTGLQNAINLWADWVQMWTRFLASEESAANQNFKQAVVDSKADDIQTYWSNAWLPARALKESPVFKRIENITAKNRVCIENCLQRCGYRDGNALLAQMCILKELIKSTEWGDWEWLMFVWTSAIHINKIETVEEIMQNFRNLS